MTLALIDPTSSYRVHKTCYSSFAKLPHATSQVKRLQESLSPSALVINNDNKKCTPATSCPDFPSARVTLLLGSAPLKSTQNWKMQVFSLLLSLCHHPHCCAFLHFGGAWHDCACRQSFLQKAQRNSQNRHCAVLR